MTPEQKQNLEHEKSGLNMDLIFNTEYGAGVVADYVAQKEAGETPTIDISVVNAKRKVVKERMKQIDDTVSGLNIDVTVNLINCSHSGRTGVIRTSLVKSSITLDSLAIENIVGNLRDPEIKIDGELLVKDVDYTFINNSIKATEAGYRKIVQSSILNAEIVGD